MRAADAGVAHGRQCGTVFSSASTARETAASRLRAIRKISRGSRGTAVRRPHIEFPPYLVFNRRVGSVYRAEARPYSAADIIAHRIRPKRPKRAPRDQSRAVRIALKSTSCNCVSRSSTYPAGALGGPCRGRGPDSRVALSEPRVSVACPGRPRRGRDRRAARR